MAKDRNKRAVKENKIETVVPELENPSNSPAEIHALYKNLTSDEQADFLKLVLGETNLLNISDIVQDLNTPGALDLLMDKISYYHFYPVFRETKIESGD